MLVTLFCLLAEATGIGVAVISKSPDAAQLTQRIVRRLEEAYRVKAHPIEARELFHDPEPPGLTERVASFHSNSESTRYRMELEARVADLSTSKWASPSVQTAAMALALHHREDSDGLRHWLELALKIHPRLELSGSTEWDELTQYPEVALQIDVARRSLRRDCDFRVGAIESGARVFLNGFRWKRGEKLGHAGPFWLRIESSKGVFERWVSCGTEALQAEPMPSFLAPSRTEAVLKRLGLDRLVVAWGEGEIQFAEVDSTGSVRKIKGLSDSMELLLEHSASRPPFELAPNPNTQLSPLVLKHDETPRRNSTWLWVTSGVLAIVTYGLVKDRAVSIEGSVE